MKNYIFLALTLCAALSACDYEAVNTNVYGVSDEELGPLKYGARFMNMQQKVIPIGSPTETTGPGNDLQNTDLISSGNYIGYFGNNNDWNDVLEATWNFADARMAYAYQNFYSNMFQSWNEIYQLAKDADTPSEQAMLAVTNIVKNAGWLRATDVFGPISYTTAGDGSPAPKFDSQATVYKAMMEDLAKSVDILKNVTFSVLADYDVIYNGDARKWTKLANSLMLRMAVRTHFVDEALAKTYIERALDPANGGVIETVTDEAKIASSDKMPLKNSMIASVDEYGETRMGATIWSYLTGYNDPRLDVYFTQGTYGWSSGYYPIAPTNDQAKQNEGNTYGAYYASKPKVSSSSPLYWFRASETYFLKAEAALYGLYAGGDAKTLYQEGVRMSFEENGASGADSYLVKTDKPKAMTTALYKYPPMSYSCDLSIGNTSPSWDDAATQEEQLQKIITQKYLALYPNAVEAWTEYRRTGYPYIMKPKDTAAPGRIGATDADCRAPERFRFAPSAYDSNPNMAEIPQLLGGADQGSTRLWWVRPNRPNQPKQ